MHRGAPPPPPPPPAPRNGRLPPRRGPRPAPQLPRRRPAGVGRRPTAPAGPRPVDPPSVGLGDRGWGGVGVLDDVAAKVSFEPGAEARLRVGYHHSGQGGGEGLECWGGKVMVGPPGPDVTPHPTPNTALVPSLHVQKDDTLPYRDGFRMPHFTVPPHPRVSDRLWLCSACPSRPCVPC